MSNRHRYIGRAAALALFAASSTAHAWQSTTILSSSSTVPLTQPPRAVATDANGAIWASVFHPTAGDIVVRQPRDGMPQTSATLPNLDRAFVALADGSMLGVGDCDVSKYSAALTVTWRTRLSCRPDTDSRVVWPALAGGRHWASASDALTLLGSDGRTLRQIAPAPGKAIGVDAIGGRVIVAGSSYIAAIDLDGREVWRWSGAMLAGAKRIVGGVAGDGSVRVAALASGRVTVMSLGSDGSLRWTTPIAGEVSDPFAVLTSTVVANGATWLLIDADLATTPALVRIDAAGGLAAQVTREALPPIQLAVSTVRTRIAADGDFVLARYGHVHRLRADGSVRMTWTLPNIGSIPTASLPQIEIADAAADGTTTVFTRAYEANWYRLDANGTAQPFAGLTIPADIGVMALHDVLDDGSVVVLATDSNGGRELRRVGTDGRVVWQRAVAGTWSYRFNWTYPSSYASLAIGADRVCTLDRGGVAPDPEFFVICYLAATGAPLWSTSLGGTGTKFPTTTELRVAPDGSVLAWHSAIEGGNYALFSTRLDANGTVLDSRSERLVGVYPAATYNPDYLLLNRRGIAVVDRSGNERAAFTLTPTDATTRFVVGADGSVVQLIHHVAERRLDVIRRDARGALAWTTTLDDINSIPPSVAIGADGVYVTSFHLRDGDPVARIVPRRLAIADGREIWRTEFSPEPGQPYSIGEPVLTRDGQRLVVIGGGKQIHLHIFDAGTGVLLRKEREWCPGYLCFGERPIIDRAGRLHLLTKSRSGPSMLATKAIGNAATRLDQPGIVGAWWAPYANGEGFVLDWLPDSRILFMPWFTFSRDGGNDPAGQRWYVVQGAAPANATEVELPITESTGGAFDAGPSVTPTIVGTATLSFTDCDNGTLRYRFDEGHNGAASGTITLSRLSPATQNCILADGSTQTRTTTPANGFDARMSGSWFELATSGQGMQLTVQPGGIFFAPWFTFDPAGASDDPGKQRWFTIQGSLAGARNGVATLPIVQTIGGAFDSVPTNNMYAVGSATITMLACDRAKVDYRFDDNELAAAMRNRSGSIDLVKAGGCMR